jgi:hypothetical protein
MRWFIPGVVLLDLAAVVLQPAATSRREHL